MVVRRGLIPTREWALVVVDEHEALCIVREWPNGEITLYFAPSVR